MRIVTNRSFQLRRAAARYPQSGIRIPDCGYRTAHFVADAARAAFSQKSQPGRILHVWRPTARAATATAFVTIDSHSDELSASSEASKPLRSGCPWLRRVHATCKRSQDLVRLDAMVARPGDVLGQPPRVTGAGGVANRHCVPAGSRGARAPTRQTRRSRLSPARPFNKAMPE